MTCEKNQSAVCRFENMKEEGGVALEFWQHGFLNKWIGEATRCIAFELCSAVCSMMDEFQTSQDFLYRWKTRWCIDPTQLSDYTADRSLA